MGDNRPITWRGRKLNAKTILMLHAAEHRLGSRLNLLKGSFDPAPGRSKGTHDDGGVFDAQETRPEVISALRKEGFAAWKRNEGGSFRVDHTHAVSIFDRNLSDQAKSQVTDYKRKRNGLIDHGPDPHPRVKIPDHPNRKKLVVKRADLRFGQTNKSIGFLQELLGITADGFFGEQTQAAARTRLDWDGTGPLGKGKFERFFSGELFDRRV
ncbi:MAG TPA: hypothetical protein VK640_01865 [Actinomycetes bacterium]|nr:hypothetical protein [Actinomycetes bacterium]